MFRRKEARPIYGSGKRSSPCIMKVPEEQNINSYIQSAQSVLDALATFNNKAAAIENIQIIENRIDRVLSGGGTNNS